MKTKTFTAAEQDAICNAPSRRSPSGRRDRAMLLMMFYGGLRSAEIANLRLEDVTWEGAHVATLDGYRGCVKICKGTKRGKVREIELPESIMVELDYYRRRSVVVDNTELNTAGLLFPTSTGGVMSGVHIWRVVRRQAARAGIKRQVYPHMARHTAASRMSEQQGVAAAKEFLGHEDVRTTAVYIHSLERKRPAALDVLNVAKGR